MRPSAGSAAAAAGGDADGAGPDSADVAPSRGSAPAAAVSVAVVGDSGILPYAAYWAACHLHLKVWSKPVLLSVVPGIGCAAWPRFEAVAAACFGCAEIVFD